MASAPIEAYGDLATTAFVDSSVLFRSLDEGARVDLLRVGHVVSYLPGEVIPQEGDDGFYLLTDGSAAVLAASAAGPVEIYRLDRGAFFGVGRALGSPRPATSLQALTDVTVVAFPAPVVAAMAEQFPKVRKLLLAIQAVRDREAASRLAS